MKKNYKIKFEQYPVSNYWYCNDINMRHFLMFEHCFYVWYFESLFDPCHICLNTVELDYDKFIKMQDILQDRNKCILNIKNSGLKWFKELMEEVILGNTIELEEI